MWQWRRKPALFLGPLTSQSESSAEGVGGGSGLGLRRRPCPTACASSLARLGPNLRLSGLTAAQTADSPQTAPRHWWEGDTAAPVCISRMPGGLWGGGLRKGGGAGTQGMGLAEGKHLGPLGPLASAMGAASRYRSCSAEAARGLALHSPTTFCPDVRGHGHQPHLPKHTVTPHQRSPVKPRIWVADHVCVPSFASSAIIHPNLPPQ